MKKSINNLSLSALLICLFVAINVFGQETKRILFIGNSYTFVNNLPEVFTDVAISQNKKVECESVAQGGAMFQTHTTNTNAVPKIQEGNWDFIVLQGQSQEVAFPDGQFMAQVYPYAKQLDSIAKKYNPKVRVIFFDTWGYRYGDEMNCQYYDAFCTFESMSKRLLDNYKLMAKNFKSDVSPVGAAWLNSWQADSNIVLHSSDNSHPNINGTYLAACCFYEIIFKEKISNASYPSSIPQNIAEYLQDIASKTTFDKLDSWCFTKSDTVSALNTITENSVFDFCAYCSNGNITITPKNFDGSAVLEIYSTNGSLLFKKNITVSDNVPQVFNYSSTPTKNMIIVRLSSTKGSKVLKVQE